MPQLKKARALQQGHSIAKTSQQKADGLDYPAVLTLQVTLLWFPAPVWLQLGGSSVARDLGNDCEPWELLEPLLTGLSSLLPSPCGLGLSG